MIQESAIQKYIIKTEINPICITVKLPQDERYPDPINDNQFKAEATTVKDSR